MEFLGPAVRGIIQSDILTGLVFLIIQILAYAGLGLVFGGIILSGCCDLFECRKLRRCRGRSETWQLMP